MTTMSAERVLGKLEEMWTRPDAPLLDDEEHTWLCDTWESGTGEAVQGLLARHGKVLRCPTAPEHLQPGEEPLDGCGWEDVGPCDHEGVFDCPKCGLWFWLDGMDPLEEERGGAHGPGGATPSRSLDKRIRYKHIRPKGCAPVRRCHDPYRPPPLRVSQSHVCCMDPLEKEGRWAHGPGGGGTERTGGTGMESSCRACGAQLTSGARHCGRFSFTRWLDSGSQIVFTRSLDGGHTFTVPTVLYDTAGVNFASLPIVGPHGQIYVVWAHYQRSDYDGPLQASMMLRASSDGQRLLVWPNCRISPVLSSPSTLAYAYGSCVAPGRYLGDYIAATTAPDDARASASSARERSAPNLGSADGDANGKVGRQRTHVSRRVVRRGANRRPRRHARLRAETSPVGSPVEDPRPLVRRGAYTGLLVGTLVLAGVVGGVLAGVVGAGVVTGGGSAGSNPAASGQGDFAIAGAGYIPITVSPAASTPAVGGHGWAYGYTVAYANSFKGAYVVDAMVGPADAMTASDSNFRTASTPRMGGTVTRSGSFASWKVVEESGPQCRVVIGEQARSYAVEAAVVGYTCPMVQQMTQQLESAVRATVPET